MSGCARTVWNNLRRVKTVGNRLSIFVHTNLCVGFASVIEQQDKTYERLHPANAKRTLNDAYIHLLILHGIPTKEIN